MAFVITQISLRTKLTISLLTFKTVFFPSNLPIQIELLNFMTQIFTFLSLDRDRACFLIETLNESTFYTFLSWNYLTQITFLLGPLKRGHETLEITTLLASFYLH